MPKWTSEILTKEQPLLQSMGRKYMSCPEDVDDIVQETWLVALQTQKELRSRGAWLGGIMRRLTHSTFRARRRLSYRETRYAESIDEVHDETARARRVAERAEVVGQALNALPRGERAALKLHFLEELSIKATATKLGIPVETCRSRIRRGLARLREDMHGKEHYLHSAFFAQILASFDQCKGRANASSLPGPGILASGVVAASVAFVGARAILEPSLGEHSIQPAEIARATTVMLEPGPVMGPSLAMRRPVMPLGAEAETGTTQDPKVLVNDRVNRRFPVRLPDGSSAKSARAWWTSGPGPAFFYGQDLAIDPDVVLGPDGRIDLSGRPANSGVLVVAEGAHAILGPPLGDRRENFYRWKNDLNQPVIPAGDQAIQLRESAELLLRLLDGDGVPVEGVQGKLFGQSYTQREQVSDAKGRLRFLLVPVGPGLGVRISKEGFADQILGPFEAREGRNEATVRLHRGATRRFQLRGVEGLGTHRLRLYQSRTAIPDGLTAIEGQLPLSWRLLGNEGVFSQAGGVVSVDGLPVGRCSFRIVSENFTVLRQGTLQIQSDSAHRDAMILDVGVPPIALYVDHSSAGGHTQGLTARRLADDGKGVEFSQSEKLREGLSLFRAWQPGTWIVWGREKGEDSGVEVELREGVNRLEFGARQ